jgi:hypothetical protein
MHTLDRFIIHIYITSNRHYAMSILYLCCTISLPLLSLPLSLSLSPVCVYIGSAPTHTLSTTHISMSVPGPPQVTYILAQGGVAAFVGTDVV